MYKRYEESVDHFLLHSEIASALLSATFSRVGLAWVMPKRVVDILFVGEGCAAVLRV
jgi:hypothetical protein